jgi:ubiquitin-like 1-activating enzyme E1 B
MVLDKAEIAAKIKGSKVLCVGAGGIGCELLKTLVLTGFEDIELIDMDTIETSNLNRQFLFRKHHVGMSKSQVAVDSVKKFRPNAKIVAHHHNIKEPQFGVEFFKRFSVVLNGLDNLAARKHVNRLCLAAEIPLVESGTRGYLGQVTVHIKGHSECFECTAKPTPKTFPVCTIRNTPDMPIHCVVWAKEMLFARLFGKPEDTTDLDTEAGDEATADEEKDRTSFFLKNEGEASLDYAKRIFERVFRTDVESLVRMEDLWKTRTPPTPLMMPSLHPGETVDSTAKSASAAIGLKDTHKVWSTAESAQVITRMII